LINMCGDIFWLLCCFFPHETLRISDIKSCFPQLPVQPAVRGYAVPMGQRPSLLRSLRARSLSEVSQLAPTAVHSPRGILQSYSPWKRPLPRPRVSQEAALFWSSSGGHD
jgi:hypothetical protein